MPNNTNQGGDDTERLHEIRQTVEQAMNEGDPSYFDTFATDDVVVMPVDQPPKVGRDAAKAGMETFFDNFVVERIAYDSNEVVVGEEFAYDRGTVTERYRPIDEDEMQEYVFTYLFLYRRTSSGDWKQHRIVWKRTASPR